MKFFHGRAFYQMGYEIADVSLLISNEVVNSQADPMNRPASASLSLKIKERLGMMDEICDSIGLKYASQQVSRLVQSLEAASTTPVQIASATRHLHDLNLDQMKEKIFLFVPDEQAVFLKQHSFGKNITDAFPSSTFDVSEAGACYASARWTACVFHLMRSLEVGLAALGKAFGISLARTNWGPAIDQIESKIGKMGQDPTWKAQQDWKDQQQFYSQVISFPAVAKDAWRNYTAHGHSQYTEDQAALMYLNVKAFMEKAAERLHE